MNVGQGPVRGKNRPAPVFYLLFGWARLRDGPEAPVKNR